MSARLLILGAGGFIGSHLSDHLLRVTDHRIDAVDLEFDKLDFLVGAQDGERLRRHRLDIRKCGDELRELIDGSEIVVDLIAHANPALYVSEPLDVVELNFFENWKIARAALESGARLIQFSSCEVYGLAEGNLFPFGEDTSRCILGPIREERWIYSCAKQLLERMIYALVRQGLDFSVIRPFNFIGPNMDYLPSDTLVGGPRVVPHFIGCLLRGEPLPLVDGGLNRRSYTYIDDAVRGIAAVIENAGGHFKNQIVNVGHPGNETTIRDLAYTMIRIFEEETATEHRAGVVDLEGDRFYGVGYADCARRIPDVSKLGAAGWRAEYDLEWALRSTLVPYLTGEVVL